MRRPSPLPARSTCSPRRACTSRPGAGSPSGSSLNPRLLVATFAVGGILGGLPAGRLADTLGTWLCIFGSIGVYTVCAAVLALTGNVAVAGGTIAVFGAASAVTGAVCASVRQTAVPGRLLGRVTSAYRLVNYGAGLVVLGARHQVAVLPDGGDVADVLDDGRGIVADQHQICPQAGGDRATVREAEGAGGHGRGGL